MSASDDEKTVMKGVRHGARDFLTKPLRLAELKNIWQHVIRKNLADPTKLGTRKEGKDQDIVPSKTRRQRGKEKEEETNADQFDEEETSRPKKPRLHWTKELHNKFIDAVQQLGISKFPIKLMQIDTLIRPKTVTVLSTDIRILSNIYFVDSVCLQTHSQRRYSRE